MEIQRDAYLNKLEGYRRNGLIKVITGVRRCGKSYLLNELYRKRLLARGVPAQNIISIALDLTKDLKYRNPLELSSYVRGVVEPSQEQYYLFIDEIQMSDSVPNPYNPGGAKIRFYDALSDLNSLPNLDIYVTGSNSKMLSSDILTEFRGRSIELRLHPLSFSEFFSASGGERGAAFEQYAYFGGMPLLLSLSDDGAKADYLSSLFSEVYLRDIIERKRIERIDVMNDLVNILCSSVGSLTNPTNIANSINSMRKAKQAERVSQNTVRSYMDHLEDAFLFHECKRYDVKGKAYFDYPNKYYCEDIGLRNARTGFRQMEMTHIMENIVFNELKIRGFAVDVGIVYASGRSEKGTQRRVPCEIDFIAAKGGRKIYIQSAYALGTDEKIAQELRPLSLAGDSFPKVVVRRDSGKPWYDEQGVLHINVLDFLLDETLL